MQPLPHPGDCPKRVVWVQDEISGKWMLVGLSDKGEVQDPADYEDVSLFSMCI